FVDVGREGITNVAVTDLTLGNRLILTGQQVTVLATVHNFGPDRKEKLRVNLRVTRAAEKAGEPPFQPRDEPDAAEHIDVRPGEQHRVSFVHRFTEAGTYVVQVQVEQDDLPVDDTRSVVVRVRQSLPVLIVDDSEPREYVKSGPGGAARMVPRLREGDCVRI